MKMFFFCSSLRFAAKTGPSKCHLTGHDRQRKRGEPHVMIHRGWLPPPVLRAQGRQSGEDKQDSSTLTKSTLGGPLNWNGECVQGHSYAAQNG